MAITKAQLDMIRAADKAVDDAPDGRGKMWPTARVAFLLSVFTEGNCMFHSVPGTGKTHTVGEWIEEFGLKSIRPVVHETTAADELRSHPVQVVDPASGNSKFETHIAAPLRCYAEGGIWMGDEVDRWSTEAHTLLYLMLDGSPITVDILGKGPTTIKPHPDFRFFGFSNADPRTLPAGLIRRLTRKVELNDLAPGLWNLIPKGLHSLVKASAFDDRDDTRITGGEWLQIVKDSKMLRSFEGGLRGVVGPERANEIATQHKQMKATEASRVSA